MVPLGDVADVSRESGPVLVNRDKQSRRTIVEFNVRGRDVVSTVNEAREVVAQKLVLPAGCRLEWGGQFENCASPRSPHVCCAVGTGTHSVSTLVGVRTCEARPLVAKAIQQAARLRLRPVVMSALVAALFFFAHGAFYVSRH